MSESFKESMKFYGSKALPVVIAIVCSFLIINFIGLIAILNLIKFHVYLNWKGISTYEYILIDREKKVKKKEVKELKRLQKLRENQ